MTESEALIFAEKFMRCKFAECLKSGINCDVCENDYEKIGTLDDFLKKTIEALEKQIPKKANKAIDRSWGIEKEVSVCPVCDHFLSEIHFIEMGEGKCEKITYCEICGQKIDWEGERRWQG